MAARKQTAPAPDPVAADEAPVPGPLAAVHELGGWHVGYTGDRTDPEPDESYTVAGVLGLASAETDG